MGKYKMRLAVSILLVFKEHDIVINFGNGNVDIVTGIRNDNSIVVEHVLSINSVKKER